MNSHLPRLGHLHSRAFAWSSLLALAALTACSDPTGFDNTSTNGASSSSGSAKPVPITVTGILNEDCPAGDDWLPVPPAVPMIEPAPHPDSECPFYRGAYQNFLIATAPTASGDPGLVNYAAIDDAFQTQYPTGFQRNTGSLDPTLSSDPCVNSGGATGAATARKGPPNGRAWLGAIKQAGFRNIEIDPDGHSLYYGLHMNQAFVQFLVDNNLQTKTGILHADPNLQFPPGVAEFKTAWKDIDPRDFPDASGTYCHTDPTLVPPPTDFASDPKDYSNYITTMAWIPWLTQDPNTMAITEDPDHPILRKVALVAIHSVYTLPGHPEFIWGSVQHVNTKEIDPDPVTYAGVSILGMPDSQPTATGPNGTAVLPTSMDPTNTMATFAASDHNFLLYNKGVFESASMKTLTDKDLTLNEATQSFPQSQVTNVYRVFPGSKADQLPPDGAVFSLNSNINTLFANAIAAKTISANDQRQNYRLVAAVWMDKPALFGTGILSQQTGTYLGLPFQNDQTSPLVVAAQAGDPVPSVSQGVSCGTPLGSNGVSGDVPGATAMQNTVPGCDTRADDLHLPTATNPALASEPDSGAPINPLNDFAAHTIGTDSPFSLLGGEDRLSSTSMETFTQSVQFFNCFSCHNTQPISAEGTAQDPTCLANPPPSSCLATTIPFGAKINVSHMFSEFLLREDDALARQNGN
ncbi:MAG TPA: hypothetical protein VGM06_11385 [Polyangiaceae bacterium]|jgi:hypothetical protein